MPDSRGTTTILKSDASCPRCGHDDLRITTSILAHYHVHRDPEGDLRVVREQLGDAAWDESNPAACVHCGWIGTVADVRRPDPQPG